MSPKFIYSWKRAPFIRLLIPLMGGIIFQFNTNLSIDITGCCMAFALVGLYIFSYIKARVQFKWYWVSGILIQLSFFCIGSLLLHFHNISKSDFFIGRHYNGNELMMLRMEEPLSEKPNSFKAIASAQWVADSGNIKRVKGNIIIYFRKDKSIQQLGYGSRLIISKTLQPIRNSGNPGAFDYERYCHFQDIYYQVYLDSNSFKLLEGRQENWFTKMLFNWRKKVVGIIRKNIKGEKEAGLAEALLIGYKDDLDKSLVQSYSNTGVVHVVAISGLHLGLIYWLLSLLLKPLDRKKSLRGLQLLLFISGLWLFSLLAGGGPSVIRSAVMFSFIVIGKGFSKKAVVLNGLAASAFLLLCYNPFWIWDVGFQLSYLAVWSLVVFMQPIYQILFLQNKILDFVWQMNAVTLSAQILTLPVSIFYFHQFPNLFLITNMVAVPLSSIIVVGEIFLCVFSFLSFLSLPIGSILKYLIGLMNGFVLNMDSLPFALWKGLQINFNQLLLLYAFIAFCSSWFLYKKKKYFVPALVCLLIFTGIRLWTNWNAQQQIKMIVYNTARHTAIDFAEGRKASFVADTGLMNNKNIIDFQLKPSRLLLGIKQIEVLGESVKNNQMIFGNKRILLIDGRSVLTEKMNLDILVLISNPGLMPNDFLDNNLCRQVVADGSLSRARVIRWTEACRIRNIPFYSVSEKGAFVLKIR